MSEKFHGPGEAFASSAMIRTGAVILATPDPIPVIDEVIGVTLIVGGIAWKIASALPYGSVTSYPSQSHPITSTTGRSHPRGQVKKQIRSTSHSHSRRRRYYYGKKRKYPRY